MLTAVPKRWFSWDFQLQGPMGEAIAEITFSSWRERGSVIVNGATYSIHREGMAGPFIMEGPDSLPVANAIKLSALKREFTISHGENQYSLQAISAFRREFGLFVDNQQIGFIVPKLWVGRRANVDFLDEVPLLIQAFTLWLTLLLWRREDNAAPAAATGA
jgi:hypothetical protein